MPDWIDIVAVLATLAAIGMVFITLGA